jgi:cation:H+ antiporter
MNTAVAATVFFAGAAVSLGSSWIVVSRIERLGSRLGASEAILGLVSALAANVPEITSSVSALLQHRGAVGAGVVIGSNVFNLAALLGLGSVVAGVVVLHRRVVLFQGVIAVWVAVTCMVTVAGLVSVAWGLALVLAVLVPYVALAAIDGSRWWARPNPSAVRRWLTRAIAEEELELSATIHPRRGRPSDAAVGLVGLVVVVAASVVMEHAATDLGDRLAVPGIIVGGVVLAAVTSLPNAVAAIYWANRGRAVAMLSTALNSNALNVAAGFLLPAVLIGVGHRSGRETLVAGWYAGLTLVVLAVAHRQRGLRRPAGWLVIAAYLAFVAVLTAAT